MKKWLAASAVVVVVVAGLLILWLSRGDGPPETIAASGTVEATEAHVGFPVGGRLQTLEVEEGDRVTVGAQVAALDRSQTLAERRQAKAQLLAARAQLEELQAGARPQEIAQAEAALGAGRAQLEQARKDLRATRRLFQKDAVTRAALDRDALAVETAESEVAQARERLELLRQGPRAEAIAAQRARVSQAEARVAAIEAALDQMTIESPIDGVVTMTHREPGEIVPPGTSAVTLMNLDDRWVNIYVPEDRLGAVKLGAPATIESDTYPARNYPGRVTFIASEAEFTPKNVQTKEERVKLVYAVKVRIVGDPNQDLKPGMPVDVEVATPEPEPEPEREQEREREPEVAEPSSGVEA